MNVCVNIEDISANILGSVEIRFRCEFDEISMTFFSQQGLALCDAQRRRCTSCAIACGGRTRQLYVHYRWIWRGQAL